MVNGIEELEARLKLYPQDEGKKILDAAQWAYDLHDGQKRASGEPYIVHPLAVASTLIDMQMDAETIVAGLLHDVLEDTGIERSEIGLRFGAQVENLVDGMTKISILKAKTKTAQEAETIRKTLFAMTKDIRVIIIKLADKLHNMNTLQYLPQEKRRAIAEECLDIYAPLADRLGISWMKIELEDLCLKHMNPRIYNQIKEALNAKRSERASYLARVKETILKAAEEEGYVIDVASRAKHFYSIYQKMKRSSKDIDQIYDLLGIRIICRTVNECYSIIGLVHRLWPPIEGRFKDYIAMPKANQYQSLHTTVMCFEGKLLEIQIRTEDMHTLAEYGIAAHWAYKKNPKGRQINPDDLMIINKLKSWNGMKIRSNEFLEEIKRELLKDSIFVFTPKGHIIELPAGSTPIDFAYRVHTEVGNHCYAAKADGIIIPLGTELKNTQVIEIITLNNATPHVNWLKFVKTAGARTKIRHWLTEHDESLIIDRSIIAKRKPEPAREQKPKGPEAEGPIIKNILDQERMVFKIGEERNMMIRIAQCCTPSTGDSIIGYVSRGRGIIVHKRDCPNLDHIRDFAERKIDVEWEAVSPKSTKRFRVTARRTSDLFSEIEGAVRKFKGHLIEGKLEEDERGNLAGSFTMELESGDDYKPIIKSIRTIPSVMNIQSLS